MIIGVLKEIKPNEYRVAAVPATVTEIVRHGHTVYVESGAGLGSGYSDSDYQAAGAIIADTDTVWENADLFYKVKELFPQEFKWMNKDKILFTYIHSNAHPAETDCLLDSHVSAVAYEDVPDKTATSPLLRPMSELAGKGGFLAALHYMQSVNGGPGKLLANVAGVECPVITCLGCGNIGVGVAELACGFGNEVRILDVNMDVMLEAKKHLPRCELHDLQPGQSGKVPAGVRCDRQWYPVGKGPEGSHHLPRGSEADEEGRHDRGRGL